MKKKRTACLIQELKRLTDRRNFHKILSSFDSNNIRWNEIKTILKLIVKILFYDLHHKKLDFFRLFLESFTINRHEKTKIWKIN